MRRSLPTCLLAVVALLAVAALPAQAKAPKGGLHLVGTTSDGKKLDGRVSSSGKGLQLVFTDVFHCNKAPARRLSLATYVNQRPTIKADGSFDYRKTYSGLPGFKGFPGPIGEVQHLSGTFSASGRTVTGASEGTLTGGHGLRCTEKITFTAHAAS